MGNNSFIGTPMVKIDGGKVRQLREEKGLTQLFLATSVEVTTDTISRWENKRYPTIKKENGIKLAVALEVDLEEILEKEEEEQETQLEPEKIQPQAQPPTPDPVPAKPRFPPLFLVVFVLILAGLVAWWMRPAPKTVHVRAHRILPAHSPRDLPFPVVIHVDSGGSDDALSLILKETVPQGVMVLTSVPSFSDQDVKSGELKWIQKISRKKMFAYMARFSPEVDQETVRFTGSITLRRKGQQTKSVHGNDKLKIAPFHWADTDGDGRISDEEILTVYDEFSDISGLGLDIDQVEEMWLGSGYRYDSDSGNFIILP
ncbi:MAG: helix-turn-helix transcriptional regulator [Desulfobulbaceae bacterium]|nr:helix-turn-helix transcriptional regulator [Desulfobulbaceae bacterium]